VTGAVGRLGCPGTTIGTSPPGNCGVPDPGTIGPGMMNSGKLGSGITISGKIGFHGIGAPISGMLGTCGCPHSGNPGIGRVGGSGTVGISGMTTIGGDGRTGATGAGMMISGKAGPGTIGKTVGGCGRTGGSGTVGISGITTVGGNGRTGGDGSTGAGMLISGKVGGNGRGGGDGCTGAGTMISGNAGPGMIGKVVGGITTVGGKGLAGIAGSTR